MNTEKLIKELNEATAQRAEAELDRMILINQQEADKKKEEVKRYLANLATTPGKAVDYSVTASMTANWQAYQMTADLLRKLKEELK